MRDMGTALAILRTIGGRSQREVSEASGIRPSSVSDYERGAKAPELRTLKRILEAQGFTLGQLDAAQGFLQALDNCLGMPACGIASGVEPAADPSPSSFTADPLSLQQEIAEVSAAAGSLVSRLSNLFLTLLYQQAIQRVAKQPDPRSEPI